MSQASARRLRRILMGTAAPLLLVFPATALAQAPAGQNALPAPPASVNQSASVPPQSPQALSEIVITGSRLTQTGVTMPTPVTVVGQNLIAQTGATQLSQVLNDLPQFRASTSSTTQFVGGGGNIAGANLLDLRGLGPTRTLVLVDGLRFPPTTTTESFNSDLIPSELVSRLDVVTGGASAAYGSDAVAGVVNIILDHKLEGLRGSVQYGVTDAGDGQDEKIALGGGHAFLNDRIHVIAGVDYEHRDATGNCYSRSWCSQEYGVVSNPTPGVNGLPALVIAPNVRASGGTPAGLVVSSALVKAYGGQQISASGQGLSPFAFGQLYAPNNNQMIGGSMPGINEFADAFRLQPPESRWSTYVHGEGDVTEAIQAFADVSVGHVQTVGNNAQLRSGNQNAAGTAPSGPVNTAAISIANTNPFLPAPLLAEMNALHLTSVDIGKTGDAWPLPTADIADTTYRIAAGLKGEISAWHWDVSYAHGQSNLNLATNDLINTANFTNAVQAVNGAGANAGQVVCAVNKSTNVVPGCAPLNLFGVGTASPAALAYVLGSAWQHTADTLDDVSANIQGKPFKTWAGAVSVATGVEYRVENLNVNVDPVTAAGGFTANTSALHGQSKVMEAYGETTIPLITDMPLAKELSVNAAFRRTQYNLSSPQGPLGGTSVGPVSSEFNASTWKVGFVERPVDWLRFRGTMSRDFRAPNISDLYTLPNVAGNSAVTDPVTNANTQVPTQSGGNPNLKPEIAFTSTVGFTIQPTGFLRNLQISVDYYDIKVKDYVAAIGAQTLINECYAGVQSACALVTRNSSNTLTLVKNVSANANQLEEVGTDLELDYRRSFGDLGSLDLRILSTIYSRLQYVNAGVPISGACQNGFVTQQAYPSMPCYTINSRITYTKGPWLGAVQFRYIPAGKYSDIDVGPQDPGYNPFLANSVNNNRVDAITYVDLNASYQIYRKEGRQLEVFGAINNLSNANPPNVPANNIGTNATLYDVVGRTFNLGLRFKY